MASGPREHSSGEGDAALETESRAENFGDPGQGHPRRAGLPRSTREWYYPGNLPDEDVLGLGLRNFQLGFQFPGLRRLRQSCVRGDPLAILHQYFRDDAVDARADFERLYWLRFSSNIARN